MGLAERIVEVMQAKGYPLDDGEGEVNIIYLEGANTNGSLNADTPNEFNDVRLVLTFDDDGQPVIDGIWEATTEPGRTYTTSPVNPKGAARIALGHHKEVWQVGIHRASSPTGHEALVQTGGEVTVHRDLNKDFIRTGDKLDTGYFGINQHHGYGLPKGDIGTASAGCLVGRTVEGHRQFMELVKSDPRYEADNRFKFSATVLDAAEVIEKEAAPKTITGKPKLISQEAIDLIIRHEIGSKSAYESRYRHPTWPGGGSGVTIGIGYDIGAGVKSVGQLHADWDGKIGDNDIKDLERAVGVTGTAAQSLAAQLRIVDVPWEAAISVFDNTDIPRWYATCQKVLPNYDKLPPDCRGALLSLAYNRGASFGDTTGNDRYREMRNIRAHMITGEYERIPAEIRSMKRIWQGQGLDGLLRRRDEEASLFERGLKKPNVPAVVGGTGTVIGGGGGAVAMAVKNDASWPTIAGIVIIALVIGFVVYKIMNRR